MLKEHTVATASTLDLNHFEREKISCGLENWQTSQAHDISVQLCNKVAPRCLRSLLEQKTSWEIRGVLMAVFSVMVKRLRNDQDELVVLLVLDSG